MALSSLLRKAGWTPKLFKMYNEGKGDPRKFVAEVIKDSFEFGESPFQRMKDMFRNNPDLKFEDAAFRELDKIQDEARKANMNVSKYVGSIRESLDETFESLETDDLDEVLSTSQRMKKRAQFRKNRAKIKRGREKAKRRTADTSTVNKRARRQAVRDVKKTVSQGKNPSDLSPSEKKAVERKVEKRSRQVDRLTRRLTPKVRQRARKRQREALERKASESGYPIDTILEVFDRGLDAYDPSTNSNITEDQYAFARVNSFLTGGYAAKLDEDLSEGKGGPPDEGTDASTKYAKKKIPGQNVATDVKGDPKPYAYKEDFNAVSAYKQSKRTPPDMFAKVRTLLKKTFIPKAFEKTLQTYTNMIKKEPNKDHRQLAVQAANEVGQVTPREFTNFLKKKIKSGELPQALMASYDPEGEE